MPRSPASARSSGRRRRTGRSPISPANSRLVGQVGADQLHLVDGQRRGARGGDRRALHRLHAGREAEHPGGRERRRRGQREPAVAGGDPDQPDHGQRHADQHRERGQAGQHRDRPGPADADRVAEHADARAEVVPVPHRVEVAVEDRVERQVEHLDQQQQREQQPDHAAASAIRSRGHGTSASATTTSTSSGSRSSACPVRWSRSVGATSASQTTRKASTVPYGTATGRPAARASGPPPRAGTTRPAARATTTDRRPARPGAAPAAPRRRPARCPTRAATVLHQNRGGGRRRPQRRDQREDRARTRSAPARSPAPTSRGRRRRRRSAPGSAARRPPGRAGRRASDVGAGRAGQPAVDEVAQQRQRDQRRRAASAGPSTSADDADRAAASTNRAPVTRFAGCRREPDAPCLRVLGYDGDTDGDTLGFTPGAEGGAWCTDERAFWVRAPGRGEIRPVDVADPGPGEVRVRTLRSGVSRGTETLVFRGARARRPARADARAAPGRRLPRPGEVRLPQRRRGRGRRSPALRRADRVLPAPAPDGVRRPGGRRDRRAGRRARRRGRCWPAPSRPRSTRCGTRRRWSATGSPWSAPGWSAAAWPGCSPRSPASRSCLVDVDPTRAEVAAALGVGVRAPRRGDRRPRPGPARERDRGRAAALAGAAGAGRRGGRPELVRRHPGPARPRRRLPLRPAAVRASQVGEVALAPPAPAHPRRAAGPRARPAARPGVRRAADRGVGVRGAARADGRAELRARGPRCATRSPTRRRRAAPCSA